MAVKGLNIFSRHFTNYQNSFILIGGAACDVWFSNRKQSFRSTKDLDLVLIAENLSSGFVTAFWQFIDEGGYMIRNCDESSPPTLYRFEKPSNFQFPAMIELFCRKADGFTPGSNQHIIPVVMEDAPSLSAILLNDEYYHFLINNCKLSDGIRTAEPAALIPFKARAWLDLTERRKNGDQIKEDDIKKHRNDVFRLATTLPGDPGPQLPGELELDVVSFLKAFPEGHAEWEKIGDAIRATVGGSIRPVTLLSNIRSYYQLPRVQL